MCNLVSSSFNIIASFFSKIMSNRMRITKFFIKKRKRNSCVEKRSMMFRGRSQSSHGAFLFSATPYPLFRLSMELSEPKSWIFNNTFSDLVLQSNVQVIGREHGYQHSFFVFYCVLNTLPSLVAVSTLQTKI